MPRRKLIEIRQLREFKIVDSMNAWFGSWLFLFVHILWFTFWLTLKMDINLLTMIVSLEAIILCVLLLMSQNRQSIRDDIRDEADLQADLQSVALSEKVLRRVNALSLDVKKLRAEIKTLEKIENKKK